MVAFTITTSYLYGTIGVGSGFFGLRLFVEDFRCEGIPGNILIELIFFRACYFLLRMSGVLKVYLVILD